MQRRRKAATKIWCLRFYDDLKCITLIINIFFIMPAQQINRCVGLNFVWSLMGLVVAGA